MPRRAPRKPTKRSKTFTGCWTCRSRGVKCGEEKPTCARCRNGSFHCEGYGVKLVWPDECGENATGVQRRLFSPLQQSGPILSDQLLDLSLETLDAAIVVDQEHCGPFSVFRLPSCVLGNTLEVSTLENGLSRHSADEGLSNVSVFGNILSPFQDFNATESSVSGLLENSNNEGSQQDGGALHWMYGEVRQDNRQHLSTTETLSDQERIGTEEGHVDAVLGLPGTRIGPGKVNDPPDRWHSTFWAGSNMSLHCDSWMEDYLSHLELVDCLRPLTPPETRQDRQLMHYWVTHLSDLMISIGTADNPYRTVWIPMALHSVAGKHLFPGNAALLHAIYAISAFNQAQLSDANHQSYFISATKHYQLGLRYLRQALMEQRGTQLEVVLAAINAMSFIEVISGDFSFWRGHLKGGREWLRSFERAKWSGRRKSVTYQFFLCAEAIGSALPGATVDSTRKDLDGSCDSDYVHDPIFGVTSMLPEVDYCLDQYFGITKPILEVIIHINHLSTHPRPPSKAELEGLEIKIRLNRPTPVSDIRGSARSEKHMVMDYAIIFYQACYIHFKHTLLRTPSKHLQGLVRPTLRHLQNIEIHEATYTRCGILWPIFVIACECDEDESRDAVRMWFTTKTRLGIANVATALNIILEIWHRRDRAKQEGNDCFVGWGKVMADMGLDIFII